jgi:hypothetical protein
MARRPRQADFVSLNLRLPPKLHKELVKAAGPASSLNSEILRRLQGSIDAEESVQKVTDMARNIEENAERIMERAQRLEKRAEDLITLADKIEARLKTRLSENQRGER